MSGLFQKSQPIPLTILNIVVAFRINGGLLEDYRPLKELVTFYGE
jgi:hypothetical protein